MPSSKLLIRHRQMLEYQEKIKPFTPNFRELERLWGIHSTSQVKQILLRLQAMGLVISRAPAKKTYYFAVEKRIAPQTERDDS